MTNHERNTASAIDFQHLDQYTLGDEGLQAELLKLFSAQLEAQSAELGSCADAESWRMAAHTLKGAARAVGAFHVADVAEKLEALDFAEQGACTAGLQELAEKGREFKAVLDGLGG
jgi:HPt (histidine-containing phosphotransfer) domain-containing protein